MIITRVLATICLLSVATTLVLLAVVAIDMAVPPAGTIGYQFDIKRCFRVILFLYGFVFAPGVFLTVVAPIYLIRFRREQQLSVGFQIYSLTATSLTIFSYFTIQSL